MASSTPLLFLFFLNLLITCNVHSVKYAGTQIDCRCYCICELKQLNDKESMELLI